VLVVALLGGCSSLQPNDAGVADLEVRPPLCAGLEVGSTVDLDARTFDQRGDSVDAPVWWRTPDPTAIGVDSATGRITGLIISDTARVQALVGTKDPLISDFIPLVVTPPADTLAQSSAARVTVAANGPNSGALLVTISRKTPATPIKSFPLVYRVIEPVFVASEDRTVEFPGGKLTVTPCSGATGAPLAAPQLNRRANRAQPDSAIVDYACLAARCADVPVYATLPAKQVAYILRDSGAVAVFVSTRLQRDKIAEIRAGLPALRRQLVEELSQRNADAMPARARPELHNTPA